MLSKQELRRQLLARRRSIPPIIWQAKSQHICERLAVFSLVLSAQKICAYFSVHNEPDLSYLWQKFSTKSWYFPYCHDRNLRWLQVNPDNLIRETTISKYGIRTPYSYLPELELESADLVLVPMLAGTKQGDRLGYGGGYYDRALANFSGIAIGITFAEFIVPDLPVDPWDRKLSGVITESGEHLNFCYSR